MEWYCAFFLGVGLVLAICGYILWGIEQEEKRLRKEKDPYDDLNSWEGC